MIVKSRSFPNSLVLFLLLALIAVPVSVNTSPVVLAQTAETTVTKYFDDRPGAMALNFDTELYLCGMIHSMNGYDPATAASRSQETRVGWPNILADTETYGIPVSFNICGHEAVFGDTGRAEIAGIDVIHAWHPDPHWATYTWYSDKPEDGGDYQTTGDLSGSTRSYGLVYGGDLTESTLNSSVPHEISYHNFGHESLSNITEQQMRDTFQYGVEFHKRIGNKIRAEAPPSNSNPDPSRYPIYIENGMFVFNRSEGASGEPYEPYENLWIVPRGGAFTASSDLSSAIDGAISGGVVLAYYSHPEDGFDSVTRTGFQTSLAHARAQVDAGQLWATTLSEIGRYWEAKSDVSTVTQIESGRTLVDITLTGYDATLFGIPYLTFRSTMPDASTYAQITVDYPASQVLNSDSSTVRVSGGEVIYTIYLNPVGTTHVEIDGVDTTYAGGVDINEPVLSVASTPPADPLHTAPITIQATTQSTDAVYSVNLIYQRNDGAKDARIMTDNGGVWEASVGPFNVGDTVEYYVSVTDNSGRRERSDPLSFVVQAGPDYDPPTWRNQGQSDAVPVWGDPVELYAEGMDDIALRYAFLETNETGGTWERKSTYGSPMDMGDVANTWLTSSFTWINPALPPMTTVSWRIVYQDASGNEVTTDEMSFSIQEPPPGDTEPPEFHDPSVSSTYAGLPAEFSLRWTDNVSLDGYIFGIDNGTGTFVDDPFVEFTEDASGALWWDNHWQYRREITIDNTANASALTDHAVLVTLDTAALIADGKMNAHGGDIRFVDQEELDFWVESGMDTASTRLWVKVPDIPAASTKTIYLYYGNPDRRVPQSAGDRTFPMFDSFGGRGWEEFKYSDNPVLGPGSDPGGSGTFSSVLRESDTLWRMYSSYDPDSRDIGMSTSTDGIHWTPEGVVLRKGPAGTWDASNIWCPAVWKEDDTYYMLYPGSGSGGTQMGLATSLDGATWTKYAGNPVFNDPYWATGDTEAPCFSVLKDEGTYYVMFNTLGSSKRRSSIVYSTDLIHWTPAYTNPRFPGGASTSDWNYHNFCGNVFKYDDLFYLILPGQDSSRNYAKFGLYASHSPLFPESDTEFKGILFTGNPLSWEAEDMDTPWTVQFDDKMHMYYAACGSCWSQTGMAIIDDVPLALAEAYPHGNYIDVDRAATTSQQIMPPAGWSKSIAGYVEINAQNFLVTLDPAVTGRAIVQYDGNPSLPLELYREFPSRTGGVVSAWMRASNTEGDYDLQLYGDSQATLALAVGLGSNGTFHYWNGSSNDTAVSYSADTWYRVTVEFDAATNRFDFAVYDTSFAPLLSVEGLSFGATISTGLDRINFQTSTTFAGNAYVDDVLLRPLAASEPGVTVAAEAPHILTNAWARVTKVLHATPGTTIRWRYAAKDNGGNWTMSDIYSFVTEQEDTPPVLTLHAPDDNYWTEASAVEFRTTCSDERDVSTVALYGDWSGAWGMVESRSAPGLNGVEVMFTETLPDGTWTWNVRCEDNTGHTTWGTSRRINVDSTPDPWWHCLYHYRQRLIVNENSGHPLDDYPVSAVVDTAELISQGKMQPDCEDVRVVYDGVEVPSQVLGCNTDTTQIWLQTDLLASEARHGFYLYYGNPGATGPDYSAQSSLSWDPATLAFDTGKLSGAFDADGGIISQVRNKANNADVMLAYAERGLGYLFSNNASVWYIFRVDEVDDTVALTLDGPIAKVVTAYSGESPQWIQENIFYNNQDFIDFTVYRPAAASTEKYLAGANDISPDGVFSMAETNELLRVDSSATDITVTFDEVWRYNPTTNRGYVGLVDPSFSNELALIWDQAYATDFTWKPRTASGQAGTYSLFIGGNGTLGTPGYGLIDADTFDYRFVLRHSTTPDNANTQLIYDYYVSDPPTVTFGPEEYQEEDTVPPVVTITSPFEGVTYETNPVPLSFTTSEAVQACEYTLNGGEPVTIADCADTTLDLANGFYQLAVYAEDWCGHEGSSSVNFSVAVEPNPWWNRDWNYRVAVTVAAGPCPRTNEPVELPVDFAGLWTELGETGLALDLNSVRVVEYTAEGDLIGEVASQYDPSSGDDNVGTAVWILYGDSPAATMRYYYLYWDSTDQPKSAPSYATGLGWDAGSRVLSNAYVNVTLGSGLSSYCRTGIATLRHNGITYAAPGGVVPGIYYLTGGTDSSACAATGYSAIIDGPVKKTVQVTPPANGNLSVTLYDERESVKVQGVISGSSTYFTMFPYAQYLSSVALTNQLHYYNNGLVVDETVSSQGWLQDHPDEGWACYDGSGSNKDLCFITDDTTLAQTTDFYRAANTLRRELIFPAWEPNPTFPQMPSSWLFFGDTYQDGRDFWTCLPTPVSGTLSEPEKKPPPTAVSLVSFTAEASAGYIALRWETATEIDSVGFHLYRSHVPDADYVRLNEELIPSQVPGSAQGMIYRWEDAEVEQLRTYYYTLEVINNQGGRMIHGPIAATLPARPPYSTYLPMVTK